MYISSWRTWLFFFYVFLVMYISMKPGNDLNFFSHLWKYDKLVHFTEYLLMGFLLINALKIKPMTHSHWKYAILFLLIFPILDETLQYFTPRRIPDIYDGIADIFGGLTGAFIRERI
ncbi:MAG: VanZ family protein [Candidatus Marinimicrobia bacterium]|nr:VanZ family protein [Candidatus Neomarinimicrobiota bacterium]MDP6852429.1 VanZ family protein [Candidatus Neomarinimicrobiota bacterium]